MNKIIRNRTIRPSTLLETPKSYIVDTKAVSRNDILIVNINHESKSFKKSFHFKGSDVSGRKSISLRVQENGSHIDINWSGAEPIE